MGQLHEAGTRRVLLVDDCAPEARALQGIIEKLQGHEVVACAENGAEALKLFHQLEPEIVCMDIVMPVMDGLAFIEAARKDPKGSGVPIVMLTTESAPDMKARGKAAGATGWIDKPFDAPKLVAVAKKLLG